jgi:hypothetical protein
MTDSGRVSLRVYPVGKHAAYPLGVNLYAFQARVGQGKLLATGLNLVSENPESVYLLDQFIHYAQSNQFAPQGSFDYQP